MFVQITKSVGDILQMVAKVEELGSRMNEYKQGQAIQQQDIHRIKTSFSEKSARQVQAFQIYFKL